MKKYLRVLFVLLIVVVASTVTFAQKATRISFYKKATAATVSSSLRGFKDKKVFVIKVSKGQTLNIEQIKAESSLRLISVSIKSPSGADATDADISCNSRKTVSPTEAGDYTITVYECQKAKVWRGRFQMKISVK